MHHHRNTFWMTACCALPILLACSDRDATKGPAASTPPDVPVGAEETRFPDGPTRPLPTVQLEPGDLTTSFGTTQQHVLVSNLTAPVGKALLDDIAKSVSIRTWPELALVPSTVSEITDASGKSGEDQFAHIYWAPVSPLADRWYALYVEALPENATWPAFPNVLSLKDGARVARFRTGSEPVVSSVRVYSKEGHPEVAQVVYVDFSERVVGDTGLVRLSYSGGEIPPCQAAPPVKPGASGTSAGETPPEGKEIDTSFGEAVLYCSSAVDIARPLHLEIQPGLRSNSGPALNNGELVRIAMEPEHWVDWGEAGKAFRPGVP